MSICRRNYLHTGLNVKETCIPQATSSPQKFFSLSPIRTIITGVSSALPRQKSFAKGSLKSSRTRTLRAQVSRLATPLGREYGEASSRLPWYWRHWHRDRRWWGVQSVLCLPIRASHAQGMSDQLAPVPHNLGHGKYATGRRQFSAMDPSL